MKARAVSTTVTPGAERMPEDMEGFIRLGPNSATTRVVMASIIPSACWSRLTTFEAFPWRSEPGVGRSL